MTCRVARCPKDFASMKLVYCCECGSSNLEMFHSSKTVGPHLCPTCVQSKIEYGVVKNMMRTARMGRVQASGGASLEKGTSVHQKNLIGRT
jgi:hypothetical protein